MLVPSLFGDVADVIAREVKDGGKLGPAHRRHVRARCRLAYRPEGCGAAVVGQSRGTVIPGGDKNGLALGGGLRVERIETVEVERSVRGAVAEADADGAAPVLHD